MRSERCQWVGCWGSGGSRPTAPTPQHALAGGQSLVTCVLPPLPRSTAMSRTWGGEGRQPVHGCCGRGGGCMAAQQAQRLPCCSCPVCCWRGCSASWRVLCLPAPQGSCRKRAAAGGGVHHKQGAGAAQHGAAAWVHAWPPAESRQCLAAASPCLLAALCRLPRAAMLSRSSSAPPQLWTSNWGYAKARSSLRCGVGPLTACLGPVPTALLGGGACGALPTP